MKNYQVNVTKDGRWWVITVPQLEGHVGADGSINTGDTTQARRIAEISIQAVDFISVVTDSDPSTFDTTIVINVGGIDVTGRAEQVAKDRQLAERHAASAQAEAKSLACALSTAGVSVRDIGEILRISCLRARRLIARPTRSSPP